jgi:hypothetical protein
VPTEATAGKEASVLDNGNRRIFEEVGFELVRPKGPKNTVVRRTVGPAR